MNGTPCLRGRAFSCSGTHICHPCSQTQCYQTVFFSPKVLDKYFQVWQIWGLCMLDIYCGWAGPTASINFFINKFNCELQVAWPLKHQLIWIWIYLNIKMDLYVAGTPDSPVREEKTSYSHPDSAGPWNPPSLKASRIAATSFPFRYCKIGSPGFTNIARIANAVQVTISLLVSTSMYQCLLVSTSVY